MVSNFTFQSTWGADLQEVTVPYTAPVELGKCFWSAIALQGYRYRGSGIEAGGSLGRTLGLRDAFSFGDDFLA